MYQARFPSTTPFLTSHGSLALVSLFFSRGTARVTQRRTSPRGKPSTPGGGAVPPNWSGSQGPPGRPGPSRASFCADSWSPLVTRTQAFFIPERSAREMGLQDSEEFAGEPGDWELCLFPAEEVLPFPKLLSSTERAPTCLPPESLGCGCGLKKTM